MPTPRPTAETFEAWNESMSKECDSDLYFTTSNWAVRWVEGSRMRAVLRAINAKEKDKILDVGCGPGNMLERMKRGDRTGIDLSDNVLEKARARLGDAATLMKMPAEHMTFPDGAFDKISCSEVLEHVLEPRAVLREIHRVLAPNGIAVVTIPNEDLLRSAKRIARGIGLQKLLKIGGNGRQEKIMPDDNPWHLHDGSYQLFMEWNQGLFKIARTIRVPLPFFPLRYVFVLRK